MGMVEEGEGGRAVPPHHTQRDTQLVWLDLAPEEKVLYDVALIQCFA